MNDIQQRYADALKRISSYKTDGPVDEWSEAEAFHAVKQLAREALDPSARDLRVKRVEDEHTALQKRVNALRKNVLYFYTDIVSAGGACVRFLRGDDKRLGIVHVEIVSRVGNPSAFLQPGTECEMHVSHLKEL